MSKPTLRDIAAAAGVSLTSASMILNGRSTRFNEDTVKRVRIAATRLGYTTRQRRGELAHRRL